MERFLQKSSVRKRFFRTKEHLDDLFGKAEEYEQEIVGPIYKLEAGQNIYRARQLDCDFCQQHLEQNPSKELSAPPRDKAKAGRMNVELIQVFYGAFSQDTAIAEIRPGINNEVAVGEFVLKKALKVFDFTALDRAQDELEEGSFAHMRYDFISHLQNEISKPIMPYERQREYIPTQIVAEYLKEYFGCDALIYKSSMHKDAHMDNRNIVILNRVEDFVGTKSSVLKFGDYKIKKIRNVIYEVC